MYCILYYDPLRSMYKYFMFIGMNQSAVFGTNEFWGSDSKFED